MPKTDNWTQIVLSPLSGMLDSRSKPAELTAGSLRYKLNLSINRTGSMCVRSGHAVLDFGSTSPALTVPNWDFHRQGGPREPVTFLFEAVATNGSHILYSGTPSRLFTVNNATSEWTQIASGFDGANWKAATLEDEVVFANNVLSGFGVRYSNIGGLLLGTVLADSIVNRARVVIRFSDVVMLMNVTLAGADKRYRVMWSDYKVAHDFQTGVGTVAGFQDLDEGDEILAAAEMQGALYIFTVQSIWRCTLNTTQATVDNPSPRTFNFLKIYSEPKNQTGCLVYPNTLCTDGRQLFWLGTDTIWTFNPYIIAPTSEDWLLKGSGAMLSDDNVDRMDKRCCEAIIGEFHPDAKEIWFSYPKAGPSQPLCINDRCLVLNTEFHTMDIVDTGYSAFANFRFKPTTGAQDCTVNDYFIGASTTDYTLKSIGGKLDGDTETIVPVFYRENVTIIGSVEDDIPDAAYATTQVGYYARVVGMCPFGTPNEEKIVRELLLDHETPDNDLAKDNLITLRIGNHQGLVDPMATSTKCAPDWHTQPSLPLACPDEATIASMHTNGMRPSDDTAFVMFEQGRRLYFDVKVTAFDGSPPTFHESSWSALRWDVKAV